MLEKLIGIITLKAPIYRQIADDPSQTQAAGLIVGAVSVLLGLSNGLSFMVRAHGSFLVVILTVIVAIVMGFLAWLASGWLLATIAKAMGGKTDTGEMLRVTGYVRTFDLVSVLSLVSLVSPLLGCVTGPIMIVAGLASIVGYVIGVREAAEFSTGNAIVAAIIAGLVSLLFTVVIAGAVVTAMVGVAAVAGPQ